MPKDSSSTLIDFVGFGAIGYLLVEFFSKDRRGPEPNRGQKRKRSSRQYIPVQNITIQNEVPPWFKAPTETVAPIRAPLDKEHQKIENQTEPPPVVRNPVGGYNFLEGTFFDWPVESGYD